MSSQPAYYPISSSSSSSNNPAVQYDPTVRRIQAQMKDWENCPTTDPQDKKKIVDQLQTQLQSAEASAQTAASEKQTLDAPAARPGSLDIKV